jgi:hypothetical protein
MLEVHRSALAAVEIVRSKCVWSTGGDLKSRDERTRTEENEAVVY